MPALHCLLADSYHPDAPFDLLMLQSAMQVLMSIRQCMYWLAVDLVTKQASLDGARLPCSLEMYVILAIPLVLVWLMGMANTTLDHVLVFLVCYIRSCFFHSGGRCCAAARESMLQQSSHRKVVGCVLL
jgi:hypothetical protein